MMSRYNLVNVSISGGLGGALAGAIISFGSAREREHSYYVFGNTDVQFVAFELVKVS